MSENCDVIVIFPIYGQFGAIQKPDFGLTACKTYILINSKNKTQLSHITLSKGSTFAKKGNFFQKNLGTKRVLVLKGIFSETI